MEKQAYLPIKFYPAREWQEYEELKAYKALETCIPSQLTTSGMFGKLNHFDFEYKNHNPRNGDEEDIQDLEVGEPDRVEE